MKTFSSVVNGQCTHYTVLVAAIVVQYVTICVCVCDVRVCVYMRACMHVT